MSEYINNQELRKEAIKDMIKQLHDGKSVDEVKEIFAQQFAGVSASEISAAEGLLIAEGLPVTEVQRLCDVHAAVFKGSIEDIHREVEPAQQEGHPMQVMFLENRMIENIIKQDIRPYLSLPMGEDGRAKLLAGLDKLGKISIHYLKKENLIFPYMEKHGITAPPKVMWGVDDGIRRNLREVRNVVASDYPLEEEIVIMVEDVLTKVTEMIFKEENIMKPMIVERFEEDDWQVIAKESQEIGYLIEGVKLWKPNRADSATKVVEESARVEEKESFGDGQIVLPSGTFRTQELVAMLNTLPFDITFVDKDDLVKYFSEGKERTFMRTRAIIGRNVSNCHPPASVHIVEKIVDDFKAGVKDHEDFWIRMGGKYVFIRYYAVRNEQGEYLGVLEVTQDIQPIQEITGEKRLMS